MDVKQQKYCSRCKRTKDDGVEGFTKNSTYTRADGTEYISWYCRRCLRNRLKDYYHSGGKEKIKKAINNYEEKNEHKREAWTKLRLAVESGKKEKPSTCSDCGEDTPKRKLQGHHEDYSKPLDVEWLCVGCHADRHERK